MTVGGAKVSDQVNSTDVEFNSRRVTLDGEPEIVKLTQRVHEGIRQHCKYLSTDRSISFSVIGNLVHYPHPLAFQH